VEQQINFSRETNTSVPLEVTELKTPYKYVSYFFTNDLSVKISEQTTFYSIQMDLNKPFQTTVDVRKYLGICIISSVVPIKNVRLFQKSEVGILTVTEKECP
jgi:hypothetical protein